MADWALLATILYRHVAHIAVAMCCQTATSVSEHAHTYASIEGRGYCWRPGSIERLGNGDAAIFNYPVAVLGVPSSVNQV